MVVTVAASFNQANSANVLAQASFDQANTGVNVFDQDLNTTDDVTFNELTLTGDIVLPNGSVIKDTAGVAVAFGVDAGANTQGISAVAIGNQAGANTQGDNAVAIGEAAGALTQGVEAIAIGYNAGANTQGNRAVAISIGAGQTGQGGDAVAIGYNAGTTNQGIAAVAIGQLAGETSQNGGAVAIGYYAGADTQSISAVAIGSQAGEISQGQYAVAIGDLAGATGQGVAAVAIGALAGRTSQGNNSIIINATDANLNQTTANTFTVAPVRNDVANVAQILFYNITTKEITYGNTINVAGNTTVGNLTISTGGTITGDAAVGNVSANAVGYMGMPQNNLTSNYVITLADQGKHLYYNVSTNNIVYIPTTSNVAFPVGATIDIISQTSSSANVTITPNTGVSLFLAGNTTSAGRNVTTYGMATLVHVAANTWFVSGTGVSAL